MIDEEKITDKSDDMVAKAIAAAERLEKANAELELKIKRLESDQVQEVLAGKGDVKPPEEKEDSPEEYAKKVMSNDL